jgi:sugar phosphate isomerase/epimerase
VADSIQIARAMAVRVVLLRFSARTRCRRWWKWIRLATLSRGSAPAAEQAGVILGLEDTNSARDNVRIMDRTKSSAVLSYYDVGNSTKGGFDVVEEIRWLVVRTSARST